MDLIKSVFASYPQGVELQLSDFTYSLSSENPAFGMALFATLFTFFLGFMVYVYSVILVNREGAGPYPVWMHTFYCAADFMGVWVFLSAYDAVGGFWFFMLGAVGEAVWVGVEIYCLYKTVTVERWEMWGKDATVGHAVFVICAQILIFFVALNFLRVELGDASMFKFWIFTQVIIVCARVCSGASAIRVWGAAGSSSSRSCSCASCRSTRWAICGASSARTSRSRTTRGITSWERACSPSPRTTSSSTPGCPKSPPVWRTERSPFSSTLFRRP